MRQPLKKKKAMGVEDGINKVTLARQMEDSHLSFRVKMAIA